MTILSTLLRAATAALLLAGTAAQARPEPAATPAATQNQGE